MDEEQKKEISQGEEHKENEHAPAEQTGEQDTIEELKKSLSETNDKYVRLYADFENYKKIAAKNKEELLKYANEDLMSDMLTVIDHLELALHHVSNDETSDALAEGVNLTLKELRSVLEKHGLVTIDTTGKHFDPSIHHAMSQIETEDAEEDTVIKEFRKGYMLRDRVLRAALVGVSKKQTKSGNSESGSTQNQTTSKDKKE